MRVLVVEDDASIRSVLVRGLTEEGFAVDQAADGEDGLAKASEPAYMLLYEVKFRKGDRRHELLLTPDGRRAREEVEKRRADKEDEGDDEDDDD